MKKLQWPGSNAILSEYIQYGSHHALVVSTFRFKDEINLQSNVQNLVLGVYLYQTISAVEIFWQAAAKWSYLLLNSM
jgi:hypothetical protein